MSQTNLIDRLNVENILEDLESYSPRRVGWNWRNVKNNLQLGPFEYSQVSEPLRNSQPLPAAEFFDDIDPQPEPVITSEIASGRFEDDIRRMRMAAWHGADHMMVIRTAGQSHYDGLIEGTPEGIGGVPISRKQLRATRKALDIIEDEVGRPINLHSYVSGVAGPEVALLFAEEGVNGAHQDPQYNILYRNVNMLRSVVDAGVAKRLMVASGMLQIDGAHNANATTREAWKVKPELLVQHGINTAFSRKIGIPDELIALSSVPPTAPPAPSLKYDLPYAVAIRELFPNNIIRAQMNTKYITSDTREATVTHVLNLMISRLTRAEIQSTITPDEGRNVPWHHFSIQGVDTAKQALVGMDGLNELVSINRDGFLGEQIREYKERAVLFLEDIAIEGGYFNAVQKGYFVDSGEYPERNKDGIKREVNGGVGAETIVKREEDYLAPVCHHFGYNSVTQENMCQEYGGCTLCDRTKISYIDELDDNDNVNERLNKTKEYRTGDKFLPEVEWAGDGFVSMNIFFPIPYREAERAAVYMGEKLGLQDVEVIHSEAIHPEEGTYVEIKGRVDLELYRSNFTGLKEEESLLSDDEITEFVKNNGIKVVAGTVGEDEHSVGMKEIIDIKHGGLEAYGVESRYLGTSVPIEKLIDACIEENAKAILISTIITHGDVHKKNMKKLHQLATEKGIRDRVILVAGGPRVTNSMAKEIGLNAGFGKKTKGKDVASFLVMELKKRMTAIKS
ncbi:D-ornithine 4,5-aminomutase subunit OraE [Natranaerofaba carboxydovora]|uniref:D-ornithine 4,5-aminomutase subunit OraE n=1 Tax=Natranaerofaba carboxydovora TaxID=2742683 RepID=UPI001F1347A8|nr:D-ornithine 4,5-aminomutase subunit OraE [Natranaerofaba carboxydovora]